MSLQEQARAFRENFNQECLQNISHYGFIKKKLWDMQCDLIEEEAAEFLEAADECFADPENIICQSPGCVHRTMRKAL